ncbi:hypothetical protein HDU81_011033 [Chytriomyces hyalinus]|nr:hypothetical protein HDU81_011033 [Chytriomyces hyalinus]
MAVATTFVEAMLAQVGAGQILALVLTVCLYLRHRSLRSAVLLTHAKDSSLAECVRSQCPSLARGFFSAAPLLANGHLQTVTASLSARITKKSRGDLRYRRDLVHLKDGGLVAIDWDVESDRLPANAPILIVLHGLGGGSRDKYIVDFVPHASKLGFKAAALNSRGCGGLAVKTPQLYSGSYTDDLRAMIDFIHKTHPDSPLIGIGFSLGANIMLKCVGEDGPHTKLMACISVANPFDLHLGITLLHSTWVGRELYSRALAASLISFFKLHMPVFAGTEDPLARLHSINLSDVLNAKYLNEFDDAATRRMFKFRTVSEYYRMASSAQYLPDVCIPTLLLSDLDDPVAMSKSIPVADVIENPNVILATTRRGGHIGWYEGFWNLKRWYPKPILEFCSAVINDYQAPTPTLVKRKMPQKVLVKVKPIQVEVGAMTMAVGGAIDGNFVVRSSDSHTSFRKRLMAKSVRCCALLSAQFAKYSNNPAAMLLVLTAAFVAYRRRKVKAIGGI